MAQDHIRYDILAQDALRSVIRKVLSEVAVTAICPVSIISSSPS